jgi:hypothetical protein
MPRAKCIASEKKTCHPIQKINQNNNKNKTSCISFVDTAAECSLPVSMCAMSHALHVIIVQLHVSYMSSSCSYMSVTRHITCRCLRRQIPAACHNRAVTCQLHVSYMSYHLPVSTTTDSSSILRFAMPNIHIEKVSYMSVTCHLLQQHLALGDAYHFLSVT